MKYNVYTLFFTLLLLITTYSISHGQIRGTTWGDSKEEVLNQIDGEITSEETSFRLHTIVADTYIIGAPGYVVYSFMDNQLVIIRYYFENDSVDDYYSIKDLLTDKYGSPTEDLTEWKEEDSNEEREIRENAIMFGDLVLGSKWENDPQTLIEHTMEEGQGLFSISHSIVYRSKEHLDLIDDVINSEF